MSIEQDTALPNNSIRVVTAILPPTTGRIIFTSNVNDNVLPLEVGNCLRGWRPYGARACQIRGDILEHHHIRIVRLVSFLDLVQFEKEPVMDYVIFSAVEGVVGTRQYRQVQPCFRQVQTIIRRLGAGRPRDGLVNEDERNQ